MSENGVMDAGTNTARPAGFWIRFVAYIIDAILLWVVSAILMGVAGVNVTSMDPESAAEPSGAAGIMGLIVILLNLGYYIVLEASKFQATPGKMVVGIRVSDSNGQRIGIGRSIGRTLSKIVSTLILFIGFIMIAFTDRKRGLHDMMAGTLVGYR